MQHTEDFLDLHLLRLMQQIDLAPCSLSLARPRPHPPQRLQLRHVGLCTSQARCLSLVLALIKVAVDGHGEPNGRHRLA